MRVIGGTARGRRLKAPRTVATRPTSDRVREAVFDVLGSLGGVEGAAVCDLFAGSGALGIEALSRGAGSVVFVESARDALEALRANLAELGFSGTPGVRVVRQDALAFLAGAPGPFDVLLADPPYAFSRWPDLLAGAPADLVVAEHRDPIVLPEPLVLHREYRYGGTIVTVARARARRREALIAGPGAARVPHGGPEDDS